MLKKLLFAALVAMAVFTSPQLTLAQDDQTTTTTLDTVVVTVDRSQETKREVTSNISVIDSKIIESSTAKNLGDLMATQGFQIHKYPGNNTSVGMRGFRSDSHGNDLQGRVLVLVNGRRTATGNISKIALNNVERIEVIRGPASLQYGAAAMGGLINVITKKGGDKPISAVVETGIGSFDEINAKTSLFGTVKGFDYSLHYEYFSIDDYELPNGDRYFNTGTDSINSVNTSLGYTFLNTHRIGVEFNYYDADDIGSPGPFYSPSVDALMSKKNRTIDLTYNGSTEDETLSWMTRYSVSKDEDKNYTQTNSAPNYESEVEAENFQAQLTYDYGLFRLTGGYDHTNYELDGSSDPRKSKYTNNAGFLLGKLRLLDESLIFSAGGRYDSYDVKFPTNALLNSSDNAFSPSVGIAYLPMNWLKLRANWSKGFRMPSASELGSDVDYGMFGRYIGNPMLKPETSQTWEAGFDVGLDYLDFSVTYFQSRHKDYIISIDHPGNVHTYENYRNKVKRDGIEVEFSTDLAGVLGYDFEVRPYLNLNHMLKYEDAETGEKIGYVPDKTASYGVRFSYPEYDVKAAFNVSYYGHEQVTDYNFNNHTYMQTVDHGGFSVADLTLEKKLIGFEQYGDLTLKAELRNLFDKEYDYAMGYPMPGRNFYVGLKYGF